MSLTWVETFKLYTRPRVVAMLFLGFSAGLPLYLVFWTTSTWLAEVGIDRGTIGHIFWVTLLYGLKFVWAPLVDRAPLPWVTSWLGQRRGWMLVAQLGVIAGLLLMANIDPLTQLPGLVVAALLVAFSSATQDITIDAWRIEAADASWQGVMAANYQVGYRLGGILSGAGALFLAQYFSWGLAYTAMGLAMLVGIVTTLLISEPERNVSEENWRREARVVAFIEGSHHWPSRIRGVVAWVIGAIICPFVDFFQRNGRFALIILLFICVFRLSDITLGVMAGPFYIDMGFSKAQIGTVTKGYGLVMTLVGAVVGGVLVARYGVMRILLLSALLVAGTNLVFAWFAEQTPTIELLALVISADNLSAGMAGSAFIAYLSGLTNRAYTATQYALFSSLMLLPAKFLGGFSGDVVDATDYVTFFVYAAALGIPAILVALYLARVRPVETMAGEKPGA